MSDAKPSMPSSSICSRRCSILDRVEHCGRLGEDGLKWRRKYLELTYGAGHYRAYEDIVAEAARAAGVRADAPVRLLATWDEIAPGTTLAACFGPRCPRAAGRRDELLHTARPRAAAIVGVPFHVVITAEEAGFYKPRPEPYRRVLEALGTDPSGRCSSPESAADVPGARGVGMPVYWHNRNAAAPRRCGRARLRARYVDTPARPRLTGASWPTSHISKRHDFCLMQIAWNATPP